MSGFPFKPDYAYSPGDTVLEVLEDRSLAVSTLAQQTGLTEQQIVRLLTASLVIDTEIAARLESALGISAQFWLNKEKQYRDFLAKDAKRLARRRKTA